MRVELKDQIRRAGRLLWLGAVAALLLLNGVLALLAWQERESRFKEAAELSRHASHMVLQRAETKLRQLDFLLTGISEVLAARGGVSAQDDLYMHRLLVRRNALAEGVHWLFLVRPDGIMAESSRDFPATPLNLGDREYFVQQLEHWDLGLYIGEPLSSRRSGEVFIPVSRRVTNDGGLFIGVIAAGMNPDGLKALLAAQELPEGFQSGIFLNRGVALACRSLPCDPLGLGEQPLFAEFIPGGSQGSVRGAPLLGGAPVIGHFETSERYSLVVAVQIPEALIETAWQAWLWGRIPAVLGLNLALMALTLVAYRQFRRRREAVFALEVANQELEQRVEERTARLQLSEARARGFMNTAMDAVVVIDADGKILEFNRAAERMFGYRAAEVQGQGLGILMPEGMAAEHQCYVEAARGLEATRGMGKGREVQGRRQDGSRFPIEVTVGSAAQGEGTLHVGIIRDITERKEAEWQLQRLATMDGLTGVFNRRAFMEQGAQLFELARRYEWELAVIMLDADHFKSINDNYGHHVGDEVLKLLSSQTATVLRSTDILGRLGGEEFGIILPETGPEGAVELGQRLLQQIRACRVPLEDGRELQFTVSLGVACLGLQDMDLDTLFRRADAALYEAKRGGRDRLMLG